MNTTKQEIWIATSNEHKLLEYKKLLNNDHIELKSLLDLEEPIEIEEDGLTFAENSLKKARTLSAKLQRPVIADDSGLEIEALNNFPGVHTKRWSYPVTDPVEQNKLLLAKMQGITNRGAQAVCVISYVDVAQGIEHCFYGITKGQISETPIGDNLFGYDPIFYVPLVQKTYAQLTLNEKNNISHRGKATLKFMTWFNEQQRQATQRPAPRLHVILYEPEIAGNVGTIMRTCVSLNAKLHLIEPFGFFLDDRFVARASANYIEYLDYETYSDWSDFMTKNQPDNVYCSTRYAVKPHSDFDFTTPVDDIYVMFGRESTGIPKDLLKQHLQTCFRIPMAENVRSLNVANSVNVVMYEIMRQLDYPGLSKIETQKDPYLLFE